jgi:hypothetical protein
LTETSPIGPKEWGLWVIKTGKLLWDTELQSLWSHPVSQQLLIANRIWS